MKQFFKIYLLLLSALTIVSCSDDNSSNPTNNEQPQLVCQNKISTTKPDDIWPLDSGKFWIYETCYRPMYLGKNLEITYDTIRVENLERYNWNDSEELLTAKLRITKSGWPNLGGNYVGICGSDSLSIGNITAGNTNKNIIGNNIYNSSNFLSSYSTINTLVGKMDSCICSDLIEQVYFKKGVGIVRIYQAIVPGGDYYLSSTLIGYTVK